MLVVAYATGVFDVLKNIGNSLLMILALEEAGLAAKSSQFV